MTPAERLLALAGGLIGGLVAAAVGMPAALALEDRARTRARRRAARVDVNQLLREQTDREGRWTR